MKLTTLAFMTVLSLSNVAHAKFTASYPTISFKVLSQDNRPLKNVSISYVIHAEKLDTCGKGPGHSQWFSVPCYKSFEFSELEKSVVTNEKGEATMPAYTVTSSENTSRNPEVHILAEGYTVQIKAKSGKKLNCISKLPLSSIAAVDLDDQEVNSSVKINDTNVKKYAGKTITLKAEYNEAMMNQYYVDQALTQMQSEYDSMVDTDYFPSFIEQYKCK